MAIKSRYLVDTSAWYSFIDSKDPDHKIVSECIKANESALMTSDYIFDETITLLRYRLGWKVAHQFGKVLFSDQQVLITSVHDKDKLNAWQIFSKYQDKKFSFTDCTSFAIIGRLKLETAIAIDSDFRAYGIGCIPK